MSRIQSVYIRHLWELHPVFSMSRWLLSAGSNKPTFEISKIERNIYYAYWHTVLIFDQSKIFQQTIFTFVQYAYVSAVLDIGSMIVPSFVLPLDILASFWIGLLCHCNNSLWMEIYMISIVGVFLSFTIRWYDKDEVVQTDK